MGELKLYRVDDDGEHHHVIAESEQDAAKVIYETISNATTPEEYVREYGATFKELQPGELLTVHDEDEGKKTMTAAQWIATAGRGLVGSSVF
jgi:hypothetical protein